MMPRLLPSLLPLAGLALMAGCADAPLTMADSSSYSGTWIVTDAFPAGKVADAKAAPKGQAVSMEAGRAGDAAGRLCLTPLYTRGQAPLSSVVGAEAAALPELGKANAVLSVECGSQTFASYAMMADGSLLTRYGGWLLRLERGEKLAANPAPMMTAEASAQPMAMAAPPAIPAAMTAPAPEPAKVAPKTLVYLASYKTEAWAKKGWGILASGSPGLKAAEPVMKNVEIKGKGKFVRLFAGVGDDAAGKAVCKELRHQVAECGASGRE